MTWYLEAVHERRWPAPPDFPQRQRLEVRREGPAPRRRRHDLERLGYTPLSGQVYFLVQHFSYTSLGRFAPYNALGFGFWADERMQAARLVWPAGGDDARGFWRHRCAYAWLSLLEADDRRRLAAFRRSQGVLARQLAERGSGPAGGGRRRTRLDSTPEVARLYIQQNWVDYLSIDIG